MMILEQDSRKHVGKTVKSITGDRTAGSLTMCDEILIEFTDGTTEPLEAPAGLEAFNRATGQALPFTVRLPDGWIMLGDDNAIAKRLPPNRAATALYHSVCKPGTTHRIHGDVLVTMESDFGPEDDF